MKKFFSFILVFIPIMLYSQSKVAVYVTSSSDQVEEGSKQIIGSELVAAIVLNPEYQAVERTNDFLRMISSEQGYQRSGNVDDQQISEIGKQFGVNYVCVANIMPFKESYYVQARLIDVETATVKATAREISALIGIEDVVSTAEKLANSLVGLKIDEAKNVSSDQPVSYPNEYSTVASQKTDNVRLIAIDNTGSSTNVTFAYFNTLSTSGYFNSAAYILDKETNIRYPLIGAMGISTSSTQYFNPGIYYFTVSFTKIPANTTNIDIFESRDWEWNNIHLFPYGQKDYFVFYDDCQTRYEAMVQKAAQNEANSIERDRLLKESTQSLAQSIVELSNSINAYNMVIDNRKSDPYYVRVNGSIIGVVAGKQRLTFRIPLNQQGIVILEQKSGYLLWPTKREWRAPTCKKNDTIKYVLE